jgi:hypothetical protein
VAVNSGNAKPEVEGYAKSHKFEWPILVDEQNQTEKQFGFTISLQNIYQWMLISPDGVKKNIPFELAGIKAAVDQELANAKFTFDGLTIPAKLKPLAADLELGIYDAIPTLAASKDEAAQAMYAKLKPVAEKGLEAAKALDTEGRKGAAYFEYTKIAAWFKKTDYEKTATSAMAVLKKEKPVQDEIAARQMLEQAKALMATGKKPDAATAQAMIAALKKKYPETEAAKAADKLK